MHGGRVALFGRKINFAEAPLELVRLMRAVIEGNMKSADAVKAYHDYLAKHKLAADRDLKTDIEITDPVLK
jgi:hypothetical protein